MQDQILLAELEFKQISKQLPPGILCYDSFSSYYTSQNTTGVKSISSISSSHIEKQILFTSKDIKPDAIKIGMLHSSDVILKIVESLEKIKVKKIVLDPVMVAKGGFKLINNHAIKTLHGLN